MLTPAQCAPLRREPQQSWPKWRFAPLPYVMRREKPWGKPPIASPHEVALCSAVERHVAAVWHSLSQQDVYLAHSAAPGRKRPRLRHGAVAEAELLLHELFRLVRVMGRYSAPFSASNESASPGSEQDGGTRSVLEAGSRVSGLRALQRWFATAGRDKADPAVRLELCDLRVAIPPRSRFCLASLPHDAALLLDEGPRRWSLLLTDPPWPNRSARRKGQYRTASHLVERLLVPLSPAQRASPGGCFVCVWVTNDPAVRRSVLNDLFPAWGVTYLTDVVWVKLAETGELVLPADYPQRKPLERCLVGFLGPVAPASGLGAERDCLVDQPCPAPEEGGAARVEPCALSDVGGGGEGEAVCPRPEDAPPGGTCLLGPSRTPFDTAPRVVAAVAGLHSLKPPVEALLEPYLERLASDVGAEPTRVEVFGRRARTGWWVFGNQTVVLNAATTAAEAPQEA